MRAGRAGLAAVVIASCVVTGCQPTASSATGCSPPAAGARQIARETAAALPRGAWPSAAVAGLTHLLVEQRSLLWHAVAVRQRGASRPLIRAANAVVLRAADAFARAVQLVCGDGAAVRARTAAHLLALARLLAAQSPTARRVAGGVVVTTRGRLAAALATNAAGLSRIRAGLADLDLVTEHQGPGSGALATATAAAGLAAGLLRIRQATLRGSGFWSDLTATAVAVPAVLLAAGDEQRAGVTAAPGRVVATFALLGSGDVAGPLRLAFGPAAFRRFRRQLVACGALWQRYLAAWPGRSSTALRRCAVRLAVALTGAGSPLATPLADAERRATRADLAMVDADLRNAPAAAGLAAAAEDRAAQLSDQLATIVRTRHAGNTA